jgi:hypothetical protein
MAGYETEAQTIETRFNSAFTATPIYWGNFFPSDPTTEHVVVNVIPGEAFQPSFGDAPLYRHPGMVDVGVFVPRNTGTRRARAIADLVAAVFRDWNSGGIIFRTPYLKDVGISGEWAQWSVTCPFQRDETF